MRLRRGDPARVLLAALVLVTTSCSGGGTRAGDQLEVVTVFGPYLGQAAERFAESMIPFEAVTGVDVRYVGSGDFDGDLIDRVSQAHLPDVALVPQPALVADLARSGYLVPLDDEAVRLVGANYGEVAVQMASVDDVLYGVWYRANIKSLVWYPPALFVDRGYEIPTTWDELVALTEEMERAGFQPWCLTMEDFRGSGWVGTDWIEDIVLRLHGADVYDDWVSGRMSFEDGEIRRAFEAFGKIVFTPGRVVGGVRRMLGVLWTQAQEPMFRDPPGCLLHRQASFYKGHLPDGVVVGVDTDFFVLPAIGPGPAPILVGGDMAVAFSGRPAVRALLEYLATPESGRAWARAGGYTSPHRTFDPATYANEVDRRVGEILLESKVFRFDASDLMPPAVGLGTGTFRQGMVRFVAGLDLDSTLEFIQSGWSGTGLPDQG